MALTNITGDRIPPLSFRNRIINGDMRVDQRNFGAQQIVTTAGSYTCDRWMVVPTGNSVACQRTSNSTGWFYTITGNTAVTAMSFKTRLEGNNVLDLLGNSVTLSAKISSSTLTTITWNALYPNNALDAWGTSANNINFANSSFTINTTATVYTSTFTVNSSCANGLGIELTTGSFTSGTLTITDVQLEYGSVSTPFERLPLAEQLRLCQRYYFKSYPANVVPGTNMAATGNSFAHASGASTLTAGYMGNFFAYPVTMRAAVTPVFYDDTGAANKVSLVVSGGPAWSNGNTSYAVASSYDMGFSYYVGQMANLFAYSFNFVTNGEIY